MSSRRVVVDGKQFALRGERFKFRGVTYGTFRPNGPEDARFPDRERIKLDFEAMNLTGFTVVRTYTEPSEELLDVAADSDLRVLAGTFWLDWRYLVGTSIRDAGRMARDARAEVRAAARRLAGNEQVLALCLGNEVPADVIRWYGAENVARLIRELTDVVRQEDADRLVTYANYPTAEYLRLEDLDFLTFNLFLERRSDFRSYLTRLQHLAADRPLVLGEIGVHADATPEGEQRQADLIDWQLETAIERGVAGTCIFSWTDEWWVGDSAVDGWHFGLTTAERTPKPALGASEYWNRRSVADLHRNWPTMTVVICAYNAAATLDECLRHTCELNYPGLEILVVDDGSTDATPDIARGHPRARLVTIPHAGLSVARNEGLRAATGAIVAYLDADAYPQPEWPYYLALGFDDKNVVGVGGPNIPPRDDPVGAQAVARAPGGPVHVLTADQRAEHIPGCNMAFWRHTLEEVGGFDPVYTAAGDDVDLCWKVLDRGYEIGFHPAALVWHHRRPGLRAYLRQQWGYGKAEALVEARHPDRFSLIGAARWRGRIYNPLVPPFTRGQRIYRGIYGSAPFQSVYQAPVFGLELAHQVVLPLALPTLLTLPLGIVNELLAVPGTIAALLLLCLFTVDYRRTVPPRRVERRSRFRASVAVHHLLQPLARTWGRLRTRPIARSEKRRIAVPGPITMAAGVMLLPAGTVPRESIAAAVMARLRGAGIRIVAPTGWEPFDARLLASALIFGDVMTSAHPAGHVQLRVRRRVRWHRVGPLLGLIAGLSQVHDVLALALTVVVLTSAARGFYRTGPLVQRTLRTASA